MGYRTLGLGAALLIGFVAACGLSVTGSGEGLGLTDGDSGAPGSSSGDSSVDTTTEGGAFDDEDDGGAAEETIDAGDDDTAPIFDGGTADASAVTCIKKAAIFWDTDADNKSSATGLQSYMQSAAGGSWTVALGGAIGGYHGGGDADPHGKGVVIMILGRSYQTAAMPSDGQSAIADQVAAGVGLVTSEFFDDIFKSTSTLSQFSLVSTLGSIYYRSPAKIDFADTRFWSGSSFTTAADVAFETVKTRSADVAINATVSRSSQSGTVKYPMVVSAERGATRIANCSLAINYPEQQSAHLIHPTPQPTPPDDSLAKDDNVKKLFTNMATWAAHCP